MLIAPKLPRQLAINNTDNSICWIPQNTASELIKLWSFTLTEYHRVVHLDIDSMLLQPLDELLEHNVDLVYTTDVTMATSELNMPVQVIASSE
jgi:alpha-N-acetylglucosamine transferase